MKFRKLFLIPVAASILAAPVMAQYGSSGQTKNPSGSGSGSSSRQSSGSSGTASSSGMSGSMTGTSDSAFTITSTDKNANTIQVRTSGQDLSQFKQGQQISLNLDTATSGPGRSDQTPSRGNEPYGQAKKGVSATVVSTNQSAKTMTLRLASASDFSTLKTGSHLTISQEQGSSMSTPSSRSTDSQGLSGGSGSSGNSPSTTSPSGTTTSPSGTTSPNSDRQNNPNDVR